MRRGFTLVETLVVLVIMGLLTATVVISWPAGDTLRKDASALAARATLASQASVMAGVAMGLDVTTAGYAFYRLTDGVWREVEDERALRRQLWRPGVAPLVRREGFGTTDRRAASAARTPTVVFDPTGLMPLFSITLSEGGARIVVTARADGVVAATETVPHD